MVITLFDRVFKDDTLVACIYASMQSAKSMSDSNALVQSMEHMMLLFEVPSCDLTGFRDRALGPLCYFPGL